MIIGFVLLIGVYLVYTNQNKYVWYVGGGLVVILWALSQSDDDRPVQERPFKEAIDIAKIFVSENIEKQNSIFNIVLPKGEKTFGPGWKRHLNPYDGMPWGWEIGFNIKDDTGYTNFYSIVINALKTNVDIMDMYKLTKQYDGERYHIKLVPVNMTSMRPDDYAKVLRNIESENRREGVL